MSEDENGTEKPAPAASAAGGKAEARAERQARLAAALRQNLRRRKAPAEPSRPGGRTTPDSSQD